MILSPHRSHFGGSCAGTAASCLRHAGSTERSAGRLGFPAPLRQDEFGIAVRLLASLEDQVAGRLEGDAVEAGRHRPVERIALVLPIPPPPPPLHPSPPPPFAH